MRKFLLFFTFAIISAGYAFSQANLFISEVADPKDEYSGRFIELYNAGSETVDFSTVTIYLSRQSNGGSTWGDQLLSGTVAAGETYVIGQTDNFLTNYGFSPDLETGILSGNGDDAFFLYSGGDHTTGTLHDIYGVIDEDGSDKAWEYTDGRAERNFGVNLPNTTWTASEWTITRPANVADFDPGTHAPVADTEAPAWASSYPAADNILETGFDILAQLDEYSTVYYVVLATGETAPTVAEVMAGTGSGGATAAASGSFGAGTSEASETVSGLTTEVSYTVYLVAEDDEATPNVQDAVVSFEVTPVAPPDVLFWEPFDSDLGNFTAVSVLGDIAWYWEEYSSNGYAEMSAYVSGADHDTSEDWLISGPFNMDAATDEKLSFKTVNNYGDENTVFMVLLSDDFSGEYTAEAIAAANWEDITSEVTLSPGSSWSYYESGEYDLSTGTGTGYLAFKYTYPGMDTNSGLWQVDEVLVTGYLIPGSDATLSDLKLDDVSIDGFDGATTSYTIELAAGTTAVPAVSYTTTDENATVVVTDATDLSGDEAARTTTIVVTAQDEVTEQTYTILFNPVIEAATVADLRAGDQSRVFLLSAEVLLTYQNSSRNQKYIQDATGGVLIDDSPGVITTSYAIGDIISGIKGTLTTYGGLLEFVPSENPTTLVSSGNDVVAEVITIDQLNNGLDTYEAKFISIEGVSFEDAGSDFASKTNYNFNDGTNTAVLRTNYSDLDYIGTGIPVMADISGLVIQYNGTAQIFPRSATDMVIYSSDASLSDLKVNDESVDGFVSGTLDYAVVLPVGTTDVPDVTYTTTDANATVVVTDATDLTGDETARTTTVEVTSQDMSASSVYSIVFTIDNTGIDGTLASQLKVFPVPASDEIVVSGLEENQSIEIINLLGSVVRTIEVYSSEMTLEIRDLDAGIYMIRTNGNVLRFIKE